MSDEAQRRGEEVAKQLLDAAPDAMLVIGSHETISFVNLQTEALFGYARPELLGRHLDTLIPERYRATHHGHIARFFSRPATRPMGSGLQLFGRRKDGTEIPIEVSLSMVQLGAGTSVCAAIRDITDRRRIEAAAKINADRLASAVESIEDALALYDAQNHLVLCNSAYRELVGGTFPGPLIGMPYARILDTWLSDVGFLSNEERARVSAEHVAEATRFELRTLGGRHLRVMNRRTVESGFVQTIWDLTDDVRRAQELLDARRNAEAASEAKSEFLSSMSHELRTPLNAILGFAQLLQRDKKSPLSDRHRERIDHILKGGEHLLHLIDDVLDLSRIEAGAVSVSTERVSLCSVLSEVETTLDPMAARAGVALVIDALPVGLEDVVADRTRLKQILMNYGSNAIKYGRKGSATFRAAQYDTFVRVTVVDDGMGIPADKQDRVFQPFQRAGQETGPIEGTGIGLAITKRLAELMGSTVGFESVEGQGSKFWIDLPIYRANTEGVGAGGAQARVADSPLSTDQGPCFLVVYIEDNPPNIAFMQDLLADFERVELLTAPTAEIGIELVRARQPDVVIMDINLPGMSGLEATRLLRAWPETTQIPVIALSAAAMAKDTARVSEAGFYRYLTKPVRVDELAQVLEELLLP